MAGNSGLNELNWCYWKWDVPVRTESGIAELPLCFYLLVVASHAVVLVPDQHYGLSRRWNHLNSIGSLICEHAIPISVVNIQVSSCKQQYLDLYDPVHGVSWRDAEPESQQSKLQLLLITHTVQRTSKWIEKYETSHALRSLSIKHTQIWNVQFHISCLAAC